MCYIVGYVLVTVPLLLWDRSPHVHDKVIICAWPLWIIPCFFGGLKERFK